MDPNVGEGSVNRTTVETSRSKSLFRALIVLLGVALAGIVSIAGWRYVVARLPAYHTASKHIRKPAHFTPAEEDAFFTALANGDPLPEGWEAGDEGEVTGKYTGFIDPFHLEAQILVTLADEPDHLDSATLEVNGAVVASVSRAAGTIVDENGKGVVRILAMIPIRGRRAVVLRWTSPTGVVRSASSSW